MARGSSYGDKPTLLPSTAPTNTVPQRATRPVTKADEPQKRTAHTRRSSQAAPLPVEEDKRGALYDIPRPQLLARHRHWLTMLLVTLGCVVIGAIVLATAGMYLRLPSNSQVINPPLQSFPISLGGSYSAYNLWENSTGPLPAKTPIPTNPGPYPVLGKPTISASFINQVLTSYHSPTAGMGQSLYDLGLKYGIDPVYAMAFFMHESLFGTTGEARVTLSLGNERCIPDRPCIDQNRGGYARMNSWQDGFEQWYKLIRNLYVAQWGRVTVDQIIPKYAPNSDGNNEAAYIASLKHCVDTWRAGLLRP
jgi:hypothetical protein